MTEQDQKQLGNILWGIADQLRGAIYADNFGQKKIEVSADGSYS